MEMQYFVVGALLVGVALFIFYSRIYLLQVEIKEQGERIRVLTSNNHLLASGVRTILESGGGNGGSGGGGVAAEVKADLTSVAPAAKVADVNPITPAKTKPISAVLADESDPEDEDLIDDITIRTILRQNSQGRFASISGMESDGDGDGNLGGDRAKVELIEEVNAKAVPEHVEGVKPLQAGTPADVDETNAAEPADGAHADDSEEPVASGRVDAGGCWDLWCNDHSG